MSEDSRLEQWVKASISTAKFDAFMMPNIQGLGRLDINLILEDRKLIDSFDKSRNDLEANMALTDHVTTSYLWVLGAYEAVRTMAQRIHENKDLVSEGVRQEFVRVKKAFNRVRVPLAKMEPAGAHKKTDSHIAYPGFDFEAGVAWRVSEDTIITRRYLSDQLLGLLEQQRSEQIRRSNDT